VAQTLNLSNYDDPNIKETAKINADVAVDDTSLAISFSDDLEEGDLLYLGRLGSESGEVVTVATIVDSENITIAAATKPHSRFEDATVIFGNQIKIYRASNVDGSQPDDTSFSFLDTTNIDFDQLSTSYIDDTGGADYWYKYIYRNSGGDETFLTDSSAARGGGVGNYCSIQNIREEAGFQNNRYITDSQINNERQAAQDEINGELSGIYTLPFEPPINPMITRITKVLAAGFLLSKDYGVVNTFSTNNGATKTKEARDLLAKIASKEYVLNDATGTDTSIPGTGRSFGGWPDETTATADPSVGGAARNIRMSDIF
jgi:hypothetical protein